MWYFLRWTDSPSDDIKRNFSGHLQCWYKDKESAFADYAEEKAKGRDFHHEQPLQDPVSGMWNSDPEWGISGYGFQNEEQYTQSMEQIKEIAYFHNEGRGQDLYLFQSNNIGPVQGFDGEELFRDIKLIAPIEIDTPYQEVVNLIKSVNEIRTFIRGCLFETISPNLR